jgi:hypothetical protein
MRTTISIDDDVLMAAEDLAARHNKTVGEIIPLLPARVYAQVLRMAMCGTECLCCPIRPGATPVTLELVNCLRDGFPG